MKNSLLLALLFILTVSFAYSKDYKVTSPDGKISVNVYVGTEIKWSATIDDKEVINSSKIAMTLDNGKVLGNNEKVKSAKVSIFNEVSRPVVANKRSEITDNCNILTISFTSGFALQFRALMMELLTGLKPF